MAFSLATGAMYGFLNTCSYDAFLCRASRMAKKVKKHQVPAAAAICQNDHLSTTDGLGVSRRPIRLIQPLHPLSKPSIWDGKVFDSELCYRSYDSFRTRDGDASGLC